jgi:hypothetical protein
MTNGQKFTPMLKAGGLWSKTSAKGGRGRFDYRYRWLSDVPLRGDADAMTVN